jgi:ligand-binding sensor domain-containing protein
MPVLVAQAVNPKQPPNDYVRTRFAHEQGLPFDLVERMVQSRDGFLWLRQNGTRLVRFDGRHFMDFGELGRVLSMALAPNGDLWVGTTADLKQIPASALNQFGPLPATSYHPGTGLGNNVSALRFTRGGVLWVGTAAGLYVFGLPGVAISLLLGVRPRIISAKPLKKLQDSQESQAGLE